MAEPMVHFEIGGRDRAPLGGKVLMPFIPFAGGKFSWIADPEGSIIGLYQDEGKPA